ncbi:SDH7 Succinate dehydrogenase assembly factor 3 [Candida maltosa Xu316]
MRPSLIRLVKPRRPERKTSPLIPPLQLYRAILRAHIHKLPPDLRYMGDQYVKKEFKDHKSIDNPLYIVGFLTEWQDYLKQIDGGSWLNDKLSKEDLDKMSPEQIGQLYELSEAAKKLAEDSE